MLSWKTNLVLLALGLIYPIAMAIRDHYKKKREKAVPAQSQHNEEKKNE